ncbi:MAG TPA: PKD domain-containing protein [Thermoanaerobaculia bacterium]|nr:PKD domain-containing protein [Thermoanaerobaculia bacterium]
MKRHRDSPNRRRPTKAVVPEGTRSISARATEANTDAPFEAVVSSAVRDLATRDFPRGGGKRRLLEPLFELSLLQRIYVRIARWMDVTGERAIVQADALLISKLAPAILGDVRATADIKQTMYHWRLALKEPVKSVGIAADRSGTVTFHYADANGSARFWFDVAEDQKQPLLTMNEHAAPIVSLQTVVEQTSPEPPYSVWTDRLIADAARGNERARAAVSRLKRVTFIALVALVVSVGVPLALSGELRAAAWDKIIELYQRIVGASVTATPEMLRSIDVSASGACVEGRPNIRLTWRARDAVQPPLVLVRNGEVIRRDLNTVTGVFDDTDVVSGRTYSYLIGKQVRDRFITGTPMTTRGPECPTRSFDIRRIGSFPLLAATPESGNAPLTVTFVAESDQRSDAYTWDFDDRTRVTTVRRTATHTFAEAGSYEVTCRSQTGAYVAKVRILVSGSAGPRTPLELQRLWHADLATASQFGGTNETEFVFRVRPIANVVAYRWLFGDCKAPVGHADASAAQIDCFTPPTANPEIRYRFARGGGTENVHLMMIYDSGEVVVHYLGSVWITAPDDPPETVRASDGDGR